jgi:hypothetical protein
VRAFPAEEVVKSGRWIAALFGWLRWGRTRAGQVDVGADRRFDLAATAYRYGASVAQLEAVLAARQRATARFAYLAFGLGWLFFLAWLYRAATMPWTTGHVLPLLEFAPFCLVFFLVAFRAALQNFQIRTRRLARASEYLRTSESFWPS